MVIPLPVSLYCSVMMHGCLPMTILFHLMQKCSQRRNSMV
jgi:hypothetical protein